MQLIRYTHKNALHFGRLDADGETIHVLKGDLFAHQATGKKVKRADVKIEAPLKPGKIVALWNQFHALAAKLGQSAPKEPLYFLKSTSAVIATEEAIKKPQQFEGKVIFEGELGIVIGKTARNVSEADAPAYILGYTCVNDVTAVDLLKRDPTFDQWSRSKSFDTFCPLGPTICTDLDLATARIVVTLDGVERQNYPVSDMVFSPAKLVALISQDMTLEAGDVIACGTSVGAGTMKPGNRVEVSIVGVGALDNPYQA